MDGRYSCDLPIDPTAGARDRSRIANDAKALADFIENCSTPLTIGDAMAELSSRPAFGLPVDSDTPTAEEHSPILAA